MIYFNRFDAFKDKGSFFEGLQAGRNYMLLHRRHFDAFPCIAWSGELHRDGAIIPDGAGPE